eukprot:7848727-Pyramimonas_sp.AAC.1
MDAAPLHFAGPLSADVGAALFEPYVGERLPGPGFSFEVSASDVFATRSLAPADGLASGLGIDSWNFLDALEQLAETLRCRDQ